MSSRHRVTLFLGLIAIASSLRAAGNFWTSNGPDGGLVRSLAVDPLDSNIAYAVTNRAVFKTTNGGAIWKRSDTGIVGDARTVTIVLGNVTALYATTFGGGTNPSVFKSIDAGATWTAANVGLGSTPVICLAASPANPAILYVGTAFGVYKSLNAGASWFAANNGLATGIYSLAVHPSAFSQRVYAGSENRVFISDDGGASWTASVGLGVFATSLIIDNQSPLTLFVGTRGFGVLRCSPDTEHCTQLNSDNGISGANVISLDINRPNPSVLYASTAAETPPSPFFYPKEGRLFKTTDSGSHWTQVDAGLPETLVTTIAIVGSPFSDANAYVGHFYSGVSKTIDAGATWNSRNSGLAAAIATAVVVNPQTPSTLYAAVAGATGGVWKSSTNGAGWARMSAGLETLVQIDEFDPSGFGLSVGPELAIDPSAPGTLYLGGPVPAGSLGNKLFKSTDGAANWVPANAGFDGGYVTSLLVNPSNSAIVFAGSAFGSHLYKSIDAGTTWSPSNMGLPFGRPVFDLAVVPSNPSILFAALASSRLYKSTDGGGTWSGVFNFPSTIENVAVHPSDPMIVYAGGRGNSVFKSTDGGANWSLSTGILGFIRDLAVDPTTPSIVYAATEVGASGVFRSVDSGATWAPFANGLPFNTTVLSLAVSPSGAFLHAATFGGGVFDYQVVADEDGIPAEVEDAAPNGGDGNSDGIPDSQQAHVASFPNVVSGAYVTLVAPLGTWLVGVHSIANPSPATSPPGQSFPDGLLEFTVQGVPTGGGTSVTLLLHSGFQPSAYWKYGPEQGDASLHWYEFSYNGVTGAQISGSTVILNFVDGGRGDSDLTADGRIVDPGGPASGDNDGDGVPNDIDACPASNLAPTIVIGGCDSGVGNLLLAGGCTVSDRIAQIGADARNHGQFVRGVAKFTTQLVRDGMITGKQQEAIQACAARASLP